MIKLINKSNAVVGMVVNVLNRDGTTRLNDVTITKFDDFTICNSATCFIIDHHYFELVSMPERRRLTWEYAKSVFPNWPFTIYNENGREFQFQYAHKSRYNWLDVDIFFGSNWDECGFFIDAPHPDIPEVPEPWLVEEGNKLNDESFEKIGVLNVGEYGCDIGFDTAWPISRLSGDFVDIYIKKGIKC